MIKNVLREFKEDKEDQLKSKLRFLATKNYFVIDLIVLKKKQNKQENLKQN